jgi:hypothetical protein
MESVIDKIRKPYFRGVRKGVGELAQNRERGQAFFYQPVNFPGLFFG